jgi:hypothetical protein
LKPLFVARHAANVKSEPIDTHLQSGLKVERVSVPKVANCRAGGHPQPTTSLMLNLKVVSSLPFSFFFLVLTLCATLTFLSHFAPIVNVSPLVSHFLLLRASSFDQKRKVFSDCVHIPFEFLTSKVPFFCSVCSQQ